MNQGRKLFAPETAVGTGAAEPVVDEYEAAKEVPSVDESTLDESGGRSQNFVHDTKTIAYSGETVAEPTSDAVSTGEDYEVRNKDDDTAAGAAVDSVITDAEVNAPADEVRPDVPQATKATRKKRETV